MHFARKTVNVNNKTSTFIFIALNVVRPTALHNLRYPKLKFLLASELPVPAWSTKAFAPIAFNITFAIGLHYFLYYIYIVKATTTLLAIFFLYLSVIPCVDAVECQEENAEYQLKAEDGHNHDAEDDYCSPFCACQCCHSHITAPGLLAYFSHTQNSQEFSSYYSDHLSNISFSIWEPPKSA